MLSLRPFPLTRTCPAQTFAGHASARDSCFIPLNDYSGTTPGFGPTMLGRAWFTADASETAQPWLDCECVPPKKRKKEKGRSSTRPLVFYSCSFRAFFRLRLRAKASLTRFFSPGFR